MRIKIETKSYATPVNASIAYRKANLPAELRWFVAVVETGVEYRYAPVIVISPEHASKYGVMFPFLTIGSA